MGGGIMNWRKEVKKDSALLYYFDIEGSSPIDVKITGYTEYEAYCPGKGEKGKLWCLKFSGTKKMLGINVTNGNLIEHVVGSANKEDWIGKKITLRVAKCSGEKCIRVHAPGARLPKQCKKFDYIDRLGGGEPEPEPPPQGDPGDGVEF
jgi:hypothetical protein